MADKAKLGTPECFVIMPISDRDGYGEGHFRDVFDILISPAVIDAGYQPIRADSIHAANMIHTDIIRRILDSPLALCDLSSLNPNVMFELGIRQSFDKPVVLLKDERTSSPFDISPIRYMEYNSALKFKSVMVERDNIKKSILETVSGAKTGDTSSIVKLLGVQAAALKDGPENPEDARLTLILEQLNNLNRKITELEARKFKDDVAARTAVDDFVRNIIAPNRIIDGSIRSVDLFPNAAPKISSGMVKDWSSGEK